MRERRLPMGSQRHLTRPHYFRNFRKKKLKFSAWPASFSLITAENIQIHRKTHSTVPLSFKNFSWALQSTVALVLSHISIWNRQFSIAIAIVFHHLAHETQCIIIIFIAIIILIYERVECRLCVCVCIRVQVCVCVRKCVSVCLLPFRVVWIVWIKNQNRKCVLRLEAATDYIFCAIYFY